MNMTTTDSNDESQKQCNERTIAEPPELRKNTRHNNVNYDGRVTDKRERKRSKRIKKITIPKRQLKLKKKFQKNY